MRPNATRSSKTASHTATSWCRWPPVCSSGLRFASPVYVGDVLQVQFTCKHKVNRETEDYGEVRWDTTIINQDNQVVANYDVLTLVAK